MSVETQASTATRLLKLGPPHPEVWGGIMCALGGRMASVDKCIQSIRLSDAEVRSLLDSLDCEGRPAPPISELRKSDRLSFRTRKVILHVLDQHNRVEASFRVVARNLSSNGMGFIHGQMLLPGKCVLVQIPRKGAETLNVIGRIAHCHHVKAMIHEVGLSFTGLGTPRQLTAIAGSPKLAQ